MGCLHPMGRIRSIGWMEGIAQPNEGMGWDRVGRTPPLWVEEEAPTSTVPENLPHRPPKDNRRTRRTDRRKQGQTKDVETHPDARKTS
eukprot:scaffold662_cov364-Pavlova_lutheri.AAC.72